MVFTLHLELIPKLGHRVYCDTTIVKLHTYYVHNPRFMLVVVHRPRWHVTKAMDKLVSEMLSFLQPHELLKCNFALCNHWKPLAPILNASRSKRQPTSLRLHYCITTLHYACLPRQIKTSSLLTRCYSHVASMLIVVLLS